jgi:hypothetical protein
MQKIKNQICCGKVENKMVDFLRGGNRKKCKWWKKGETSNMR